METMKHYDARRISLISCVGSGVKILVDLQATDVILAYSIGDYAVKYSNRHLVVQGSSAKLDFSGRCTENTEVYGSLNDRAFNDGEVGAAASDTVKTVTSKVYSSGLRATWTRTPESGVVEILLTHNPQKKPRLTLTVSPKEVELTLIKADGHTIF